MFSATAAVGQPCPRTTVNLGFELRDAAAQEGDSGEQVSVPFKNLYSHPRLASSCKRGTEKGAATPRTTRRLRKVGNSACNGATPHASVAVVHAHTTSLDAELSRSGAADAPADRDGRAPASFSNPLYDGAGALGVARGCYGAMTLRYALKVSGNLCPDSPPSGSEAGASARSVRAYELQTMPNPISCDAHAAPQCPVMGEAEDDPGDSWGTVDRPSLSKSATLDLSFMMVPTPARPEPLQRHVAADDAFTFHRAPSMAKSLPARCNAAAAMLLTKATSSAEDSDSASTQQRPGSSSRRNLTMISGSLDSRGSSSSDSLDGCMSLPRADGFEHDPPPAERSSSRSGRIKVLISSLLCASSARA